ncbi:unnamed protein product [Spirodela intermedia]|uniref:[RNA-polymerase]-subunit kinase n=1 Tax=Spirodela intermedia TaxID=51605 RepID=A0A7I8JEE7_SPIIN|nr:unnamed protein product [Spirodela intermedia]CAA6667772.1 unnamed protein product [Spirodela intermedia]
MGCICSKGAPAEDHSEVHRQKSLSKSSRPLAAPSRREEIAVAAIDATIVGKDGGGGGRVRLIQKSQEKTAVAHPAPLHPSDGEKRIPVVGDRPRKVIVHQRRATVDLGTNEPERHLKLVAAGWPSWLVGVAGEAVRGWVPRKAESFEKLDKIGQGTYSTVYKARDLEKGKVVALKKVRFVNMDPESVRFMAREIHILRRLDHPNIIKLEDLVASRVSCSLYLVFEYMEHDLAGLAATPGIKFSEPQHCHSRGVLHRDIKGSNLLIDNNGVLKIADFGLATFFNPNKKQPLTSRVVTLWYRPPELLLGLLSMGSRWIYLQAVWVPSDEYWQRSRLPHATIFKPQHPYRRCFSETFRDFPPSALGLLNVLLAIEPDGRGTATSALNSEFFCTKPLACDPSSLPKYPPSKEFDAKLRDEELRRQRAAALKDRGTESRRRASRDGRPLPPTDENSEMLRRPGQPNPKSSSDKYPPPEDGNHSKFPLDAPRGKPRHGYSHSGQLVYPGYCPPSVKKPRDDELQGRQRARRASAEALQCPAEASNFLGLPVARATTRSDNHRERSRHPPWPDHSSRHNQLAAAAEPSEKLEWAHHLLDRPSTSNKKDERAGFKEPPWWKAGVRRQEEQDPLLGPLMPPGGNIEEMLKEHERQIQHAVRKARLDKAKTRKVFGEKGQFEALLHGRADGSDA